MPVDAWNNHRRLEALSRAIYALDTLSPQYYSMLFTVAQSFFRLAEKMKLHEADDMDTEMKDQINNFLKIFKKYDHGRVIYPTLGEIEAFVSNMPTDDSVMTIRDRSYYFGTKTREISKAEILGLLGEIREWIFLAVQEVPVKYSSPHLNVEV